MPDFFVTPIMSGNRVADFIVTMIGERGAVSPDRQHRAGGFEGREGSFHETSISKGRQDNHGA